MIDSLRRNTLTRYPEKSPLIYRRFKKSTTFIYPSIDCLSVRPNNTAVQIYSAQIHSHFHCCSLVWDCFSSQLSDKLQKLQYSAAYRMITKLPFDTSSSLLLNKLKWETLSKRCQKQKAVVMFKTMHKHAPQYLQLFTSDHAEYNLRRL